ncbi:putative surface protease GP63 [Trypanosoma cruzi]|uniref:Leishmanolysin-like peptidase n=1 Tax=Trypanosoma cruzi TaxID=5693 RepID=A0A2V2WAU4_TRYCR|nr:putative surface protease GP63 [Trypanosoma cruzi]
MQMSSFYSSSTLPLILLLLLLCVRLCSGLVEHRCTFDKRTRDGAPLPMVRELPRKGQGAFQAYTASEPEWSPLRIGFFTEDLKNKSRYCTAEGDMRPDYEGNTVKCEKKHILTEEKRALLINKLLPDSIKLHSDRLLVQPTELFVLPPSLVGACTLFLIPDGHFAEGITGADFILYVAAGPTHDVNVAWGVPCALRSGGRPAVGALNFGPQHISSRQDLSRAVAHEIAHALGFSVQLFAESKMVTKLSKIRGKSNVLVVSSEKTREVTRKHFNCDRAPGMELEDEGGAGTAQSHWERRNAKDEIMAGVAGIGYYSAMTMAAFEDLGYYRANWGMEEVMGWGRNTGCDFLEEKCVNNGTTKYPDMFCVDGSFLFQCTSDHLALGVCGLFHFGRDLHPVYRYFKYPFMGGSPNELTDYCPVIMPSGEGACTNTLNNFTGCRVGPNSRCVESDLLRFNSVTIGAICVEVSCEHKGVASIRYVGDDTWYPCPEGHRLKPGPPFTRGHIICPRYTDICTTLASAVLKPTLDNNTFQNLLTPVEGPVQRSLSKPLEMKKTDARKKHFGVDAGSVAVTPSLPWLLLCSLLGALLGI